MLLQIYTCLAMPGIINGAHLAIWVLKHLSNLILQSNSRMWMVVQRPSASSGNGSPASFKCRSAASGAIIHCWLVFCRCAICCMEFEAGEGLSILPCNHLYHAGCVGQWLQDEKVTECSCHPHAGSC